MKYLCMTVTGVAAVLAIIFGALAGNASTFIEEKTPEYEQYVSATAEFTDKTAALNEELSAATAEYKELSEKVKLLKLQLSYKQNYTAFFTFDDGPSSVTLTVLDTLKQYNIKATFFIVASKLKSPTATVKTAIQRIVDEGHTLAIHCLDHTYATLYASADDYLDDFDRALYYLSQITDYRPTIMRMPGGSATAKLFCGRYGGSKDIFDEITDGLHERGFTIVDWHVDSEDWNVSTASEVYDNVITGAKKKMTSPTYKNAVILMHDLYNRSAQALPDIIEKLQDLGFRFGTVEDLVKVKLEPTQVIIRGQE